MSIGDKHYRTGLYSCSNGYSFAIVASITEGIDWAAYAGGYRGDATEKETVDFVAMHGDKIPKAVAKVIFPDITYPYRH